MDTVAKRTLLRMIPSALYVISTRQDDELNAFTGSWATQASFEPPLVAVGVRVSNQSHDMIRASGVFALHFLTPHQQSLAERFVRTTPGGRSRLDGLAYTLGSTGCPLLQDVLGYLECEVRGSLTLGDHGLFIGEVVDARILREGRNLLLSDTAWHYGG